MDKSSKNVFAYLVCGYRNPIVNQLIWFEVQSNSDTIQSLYMIIYEITWKMVMKMWFIHMRTDKINQIILFWLIFFIFLFYYTYPDIFVYDLKGEYNIFPSLHKA